MVLSGRSVLGLPWSGSVRNRPRVGELWIGRVCEFSACRQPFTHPRLRLAVSGTSAANAPKSGQRSLSAVWTTVRSGDAVTAEDVELAKQREGQAHDRARQAHIAAAQAHERSPSRGLGERGEAPRRVQAVAPRTIPGLSLVLQRPAVQSQSPAWDRGPSTALEGSRARECGPKERMRWQAHKPAHVGVGAGQVAPFSAASYQRINKLNRSRTHAVYGRSDQPLWAVLDTQR